MSDYEVTLVNDNSEFAFREVSIELLLTQPAASVRFPALDRTKGGVIDNLGLQAGVLRPIQGPRRKSVLSPLYHKPEI
jgi:hypothetical protein